MAAVTVLYSLLIFLLFHSIFCLNDDEDSDSKCILLVLERNDCSHNVSAAAGKNLMLHDVSSSPVHAVMVSYISHSDIFSTNHSSQCSEVIGVVGSLDYKTARILHTLAHRSDLSITLVATTSPSNFLPITNLDLPNILDMNPLEYYIKALVSFLDQQNWTRIGLITGDTYYHRFAAELLQKKLFANLNITLTPFVRVTNCRKEDILRFEEYRTQIIIILAETDLECSILSEAHQNGFTWPSYALMTVNLDRPGACNFEGVIRLKNTLYNSTDCAVSSSSILQDSIDVVSFSHFSNSSNVSFLGSTGEVRFRNNKRLISISITQVQDGRDNLIALYDSDPLELSIKFNFSKVPRGTVLVIDNRRSTLYIAASLVVFAFSFGFITLNLVLYIYFRNEPEVKATSVSVSICMFLGCYLLVLFVPTELLVALPINYATASGVFICNLLILLSLLGLSSSLIFATLIVKMLRVYLIFCNPNSYKKKLFSNPALFLYILALSSPNILIILVWLAVDKFERFIFNTQMRSHGEVFVTCVSKHTLIWLALLVIYINILVVTLIILAFKTSKIRYKNFQDTKATNAFAFLSILIVYGTVLYWFFFDSMRIDVPSEVTLFTGHIAGAIVCQSALFVPKVFPPFKRRFYQNSVKNKH